MILKTIDISGNSEAAYECKINKFAKYNRFAKMARKFSLCTSCYWCCELFYMFTVIIFATQYYIFLMRYVWRDERASTSAIRRYDTIKTKLSHN